MGESDSALRDAIAEAVEARGDDTVRLLQELVRVPSVTGEEKAIQDIVEGKFRERGFAVERCEATAEQVLPYREHVGVQTNLKDRPNVIAIKAGKGGGRSLLLNAHVDTVENGDPDTWTHGPLSGDVVGDLLYGRGACDMKGGLVTHISALDALESLGVELNGDVTVAATVGEEDGGVGALATILGGYRADAALISEPTQLALVSAQAGALILRLTITGRATHAAVRGRGVSAFEKFVPVFEDLRALECERNATLTHPLFDGMENKAPINVGVVRSGTWAVTVPESLVAEVRIGVVPGEELESLRTLITERIMAVASHDPWLCEHPPEIEWFGGQTVPAEVPVDAPICEAVVRSHELVTGKTPAVGAATYGADMRLFVHFGQMPCVMYGAGDVGWAHGPDEHTSISELLTVTKTIACLLVEWCGVAE
jgi:acetylornithine deacetylase